jgi:voltage-gated potassium channel
MLLRRLRYSIIGLLALLIGGSVGYGQIEGWGWIDALWMVIITITTIGFSEVRPLSPEGRLFTMGLIVIGLVLVTYTISEMTRFVAEGELFERLRQRRLKRLMKTMKDHFIVVGYGRLGHEVAAEISHRGRPVVVIEVNQHDHPPEIAYIQGDGTSDEVLESAGIHRAEGLAACTGNNANNLFVTLSARQLNPNLQIVTRVDDEPSVQKALRAGANAVLNPYGIGGARIAQGLLHPIAATLLDRTMGRAHDELEMEDILVGDTANAGSLRDLRVSERFKVLIVGVRKPDGSFQSGFDAQATLDRGDIAVAVGQREDIRRFAAAMKDPGRD